MFWTSIGFLSLAVIVILVAPLMRRGTRATGAALQSVHVDGQRLADIDREFSGGRLTKEQAAADRLEIERRILAATRDVKASLAGIGTWGRRLTMAVVALGLPAGALSLYLYLGLPNQPDQPLAQRADELNLVAQAQQLERTLVARLESRPDDAEGWAVLGRLYMMLGRFSEGADAYGRVHALKPREADAAADHGEAIAHASEGLIPAAAEKMFMTAVETDPKHFKARFYLGSALAQRPGELAAAIEVWSSLEEDSPPDAPWLDDLRQNIRLAEAQLAALPATRLESGSGDGGRDTGQ